MNLSYRSKINKERDTLKICALKLSNDLGNQGDIKSINTDQSGNYNQASNYDQSMKIS